MIDDRNKYIEYVNRSISLKKQLIFINSEQWNKAYANFCDFSLWINNIYGKNTSIQEQWNNMQKNDVHLYNHFAESIKDFEGLTKYQIIKKVKNENLKEDSERVIEFQNLINSNWSFKSMVEKDFLLDFEKAKALEKWRELEWFKNEIEKRLYSNEELQKLNTFRKANLVVLNFIIPEIPLEENMTNNDLIDFYKINNWSYFEKALRVVNNSKIFENIKKDFNNSFENIKNNNYLCAFRGLLSLTDHFHRIIESYVNRLFKINKSNHVTENRSKLISNFVSHKCNEDFQIKWKYVSSFYDSVYEGGHCENIRNIVIHGYYENEKINLSTEFIIKIFILALNMFSLTFDFSIWSINAENDFIKEQHSDFIKKNKKE